MRIKELNADRNYGNWQNRWLAIKSIMEETDPRHLLAAIAKILNDLKIPYLITGGMAVLIWGRPRFTADIDIAIELKISDIDKLKDALTALGKANYIDKNMMKDAIAHNGEFNFIHGESGVKVDFWVLKNEQFEMSRMERKIKKKINEQPVYFISPEDLIISKLQWRQISPSSRHMEDIESILKISGDILDKKYLNSWIEKLGLEKIVF